MSGVDLVPLVDEGLGNSAYLVDLGDGRALVVDVSRDLRAVHEAAAKRGFDRRVCRRHPPARRFPLRRIPTRGNRSEPRFWPRRPATASSRTPRLHDGDEVDLGGLRLRALLTPGHTHEHVAFLLLDGDREVGVFTGGSLIVGSAARTDLVSEEPHRGTHPRPVRLAAPAGRPAWRSPGVAHPRCRIVLLGAAGHRTHQHHRARAGHQPAAASHRRKCFRGTASRLVGQLSALLPPARRDQPRRPAAARR